MVAQSLAANQVRLSGVPFHDVKGTISTGGKYLEKHLNAVGYTIKPENERFKLIYSTDIVQCYPGKKKSGTGDNIPITREIDNCRRWLRQELELMEPKVILLFGTPATKAFYRHYLHESFTKLVDCYLKPRTYQEIQVFSLPHPTSMVRGKSAIYEQTFGLVKKAILD